MTQFSVSAREATADDLADLVRLYRGLAEEMTALHPMWPWADGLAEPIDVTLAQAIGDQHRLVVMGEVAGVPLGFLVATEEALLPQAGGERVGSIRIVFTDPAAREVGIAEAMRDLAMDILRQRGIRRFDAHVLPGHRLAKNFFEAGGFAARSIIMFRDDHRPERPSRDPRLR